MIVLMTRIAAALATRVHRKQIVLVFAHTVR